MSDWFKIGKEVWQSCIVLPCLFNLQAEYIMQNARLDEPQAGIKITRRNINNLRYIDNTILMAETEEELKSFLWSEVKWNLLSCIWLFATPWTIQSIEFSRPEYWSG